MRATMTVVGLIFVLLVTGCGGGSASSDADSASDEYVVKLQAMMASQTEQLERLPGEIGTPPGQSIARTMSENVDNWRAVQPPEEFRALHIQLTGAFEQQAGGADLYVRGYPGGLDEMEVALGKLRAIIDAIEAAPDEATRAAENAALFGTATALAD